MDIPEVRMTVDGGEVQCERCIYDMYLSETLLPVWCVFVAHAAEWFPLHTRLLH